MSCDAVFSYSALAYLLQVHLFMFRSCLLDRRVEILPGVYAGGSVIEKFR